MKRTRCAFCLSGTNKKDLVHVLNEIRGFKAVQLIDSFVSKEKVNKIFACNKSVICIDNSVRNLAETIFVAVNDPSQRFCITTDSNVSVRKQFEQIAEICNIDIGDHRSNSTKEGPSQKPEDCVFCRYVSGHPDHYQPSIYETEHFILMPNMGHFILGSLLIIPKEHIMSCAELSKDECDELLEVIEDSKYLLREIYGMDTLLWENGSGYRGHGKDKSSIVHAHIHMNPCDMEILHVSEEKGITPKEIDFHDLYKYQKNSYLLIQNYDSKWYIVDDPNLYIPRQYVRQLVAEHIDLPGDLWNWRKYSFEENVVKTTNDIRQYLISHKETLPERIRMRTQHFA